MRILSNARAYSGLAVHDMQDARRFYAETLGLTTTEEYGLMWLHLAGGRDTLVYEQPDATHPRASRSSTSRWTTSTPPSTC